MNNIDITELKYLGNISIKYTDADTDLIKNRCCVYIKEEINLKTYYILYINKTKQNYTYIGSLSFEPYLIKPLTEYYKISKYHLNNESQRNGYLTDLFKWIINRTDISILFKVDNETDENIKQLYRNYYYRGFEGICIYYYNYSSFKQIFINEVQTMKNDGIDIFRDNVYYVYSSVDLREKYSSSSILEKYDNVGLMYRSSKSGDL